MTKRPPESPNVWPDPVAIPADPAPVARETEPEVEAPPAVGRRVVVTGGRAYDDKATLERVLESAHADAPITLLAHGGAKGADALAAAWAHARGIPTQPFPADWDTYGKAAGPMRNTQMLREIDPDLVIVFPGGVGTADLERKAADRRIPMVRAT